MKKIDAKIVADSINPQGDRITTFLLTFPRFIHSELMTHRMFSRNSASSRAIPFEKMVKMVEEDPFIPIAWQKDHKGMQGIEYITDPVKIEDCTGTWLLARNKAVREAKDLNNLHGVTKQLCNRLLEPFMWHTVLVTTTEYDNFFDLRCPKIHHAADGRYYKSAKDWNNVDKDIQYTGLSCLHPDNQSQAEIHIQALAEAMWDSMNESTPKKLQAGEWHIPFGDRFILTMNENYDGFITADDMKLESEKLIKVSTARCARLSYMTFDGEIDYEKDIALHDHLLSSHHMSPFEHCARAMSDAEYESFYKGQIGLGGESGWCNNFKGFIPYRYLIEK